STQSISVADERDVRRTHTDGKACRLNHLCYRFKAGAHPRVRSYKYPIDTADKIKGRTGRRLIWPNKSIPIEVLRRLCVGAWSDWFDEAQTGLSLLAEMGVFCVDEVI